MYDFPRAHLQQGMKSVVEYWAVPRSNFPKGLPPSIIGAEVDAAKLANVGEALDLDEFFIIDMVIPRTQLGMGVSALKFFAV